MKQLILIRHGKPDPDLHLSDIGRGEINELASQYLLPLIQKKSCAIYSSTADRAKESAEVVQNILKAEVFGLEEKLWSDHLHKEDYDWLYSFIEERAHTDVLIFVTHLEYTNYFPSFFAEKLGKTFTYKEVKRGQALIINVDEQLSSIVVPCLDNWFEVFLDLEKTQAQRNEVFERLSIAGKECKYPLTMIEEGIWELTRKQIETEDVDKEADDFYSQEREKNNDFFTILRDPSIKEIFFFFSAIKPTNSETIILCMWDTSKHKRRKAIMETDNGLVEVFDEADEDDDYADGEDLPF